MELEEKGRNLQLIGPGKLRRIPPAYNPSNVGVLGGSAAITFGTSAALTSPQGARLSIGPGKIRRVPYAYTPTGGLVGSSAITFGTTGSLSLLSGTASISFGGSATLYIPINEGIVRQPGPGVGPFSNNQFLQAPRGIPQSGAITGTAAILFSGSASFTEISPIEGTASITFSGAGFPQGSGVLIATPSAITLSTSGSLIEGGISGATSIVFGGAGSALPIGLIGDSEYIVSRPVLRSFSVALPQRPFDVQRPTYRTFEVNSMSLLFDSKAPTESVPLTFDFTQDLPSGVILTGSPTIAYAVSVGADPSPGALANGSAGFNAAQTQVIVPVHGGINGVRYLITVTCNTTQANLVLTLGATLPVTVN